jgi:hypothetical protein
MTVVIKVEIAGREVEWRSLHPRQTESIEQFANRVHAAMLEVADETRTQVIVRWANAACSRDPRTRTRRGSQTVKHIEPSSQSLAEMPEISDPRFRRRPGLGHLSDRDSGCSRDPEPEPDEELTPRGVDVTKAALLALDFLPPPELAEATAAPNAATLALGGIVDLNGGLLYILRGDGNVTPVALTEFTPGGTRPFPDFTQFSVIDHGQTIKFGAYEASVEAILYDHDPKYREAVRVGRMTTVIPEEP